MMMKRDEKKRQRWSKRMKAEREGREWRRDGRK